MLTDGFGRCHPTERELDDARREARDRSSSPWGPSARILAPGERARPGEHAIETIALELPTGSRPEDVHRRIGDELGGLD